MISLLACLSPGNSNNAAENFRSCTPRLLRSSGKCHEENRVVSRPRFGYIHLDAQIDEVEDLPGEIVAAEFYHRDPNNTRLLLAPTGRGLKAGQSYFADYFLFFHEGFPFVPRVDFSVFFGK